MWIGFSMLERLAGGCCGLGRGFARGRVSHMMAIVWLSLGVSTDGYWRGLGGGISDLRFYISDE